MNLSIILFVIFFVFLILLRMYKPSWLFFLLPLFFLDFRTARTLFGSAPIYWYDIVFVFVLSVFSISDFTNKWVKKIPPWHIYLIFVSLTFGTISSVVFYGPAPEIAYIFFIKSICWLAFPMGILLFHPDAPVKWKNALLKGVAITGFIYCLWGALELGSPARALLLNNIFFGGMGEDFKVNRESTSEYFAGRPNGPFMAGPGFGGTSLLVAYLCWFTLSLNISRNNKILFSLASIAALISMLFTVSRLAIIAALLSFFIYFIFAPGKAKVNYVIIGIVAVGAIILLSNTFVISTIGERFSRWQGGALQDKSVAARAEEGPKRLMDFYSHQPYTLITGAGMEVSKLAQRNVNVQGFDSGFVSNSFLLFLYYNGLFGFIIYVAFWLWVISYSLKAKKSFAARSLAIIIGTIFIIFSDNYASEDESIIICMFLITGILIGKNYFEPRKLKLTYDDEPIRS